MTKLELINKVLALSTKLVVEGTLNKPYFEVELISKTKKEVREIYKSLKDVKEDKVQTINGLNAKSVKIVKMDGDLNYNTLTVIEY